MEFLYFWIGAVLFFVILELLTATFYGLSLALSAAVTAVYVYITGESALTVIQGIIFAFSSAAFAYFLPRIFMSDSVNMPQGSDQYI
jgi:membrane protein implicated in regulation of membrane protease activity